MIGTSAGSEGFLSHEEAEWKGEREKEEVGYGESMEGPKSIYALVMCQGWFWARPANEELIR